MEDDSHKLVRTLKRACKKHTFLDEDAQTVPRDKRPVLDEFMHMANYEVDGPTKVLEWLAINKNWKEQPVWIPSEHKYPNQPDPFVHTYELGNTPDKPIEIDDDGWFTSYEFVTDEGVIRYQSTWKNLPEHEKRYWQEEWWYEKPWDELKDPGAISEESDDL